MRVTLLKTFFRISLLCYISISIVHAQKAPTSEADLKRQAEKQFNADDFTGATPLYSQLLSLYPKNSEYNYRYGVCLLLSGKDKESAVAYLENASRNPKTDEDVLFYLGKSYMLTNNFNEAIKSFENFKKQGSTGKVKKYEVDLLISNCKTAKELAKNRRNVVILNQQQVNRNSFYNSYVFDTSSGKILVTPERFLSSADKDRIPNPIMFLTKDGQTIYYASYGKRSDHGKDIYTIKKMPDGSWGEPENLGNVINTERDEEYPYLDADGITLYFSSKGENSVGGYDIFKSVYDLNSKRWSPPENLGMPVNTPDDDILFVPNQKGDHAQYASTIESEQGKIGVRKIKLGDIVDKLTSINGEFFSQDQPQRRDAKISVIRSKDNGLVTSVRTDPRTGTYKLEVPPGDDYTLVVEATGYLAHAENFSLTQGLGNYELKQRIQLDKNSAIERMTLSNYFSADKNSPTTVSNEPTNVVSNEYHISDGDQSKLQPISIEGRTVLVTPPKNIIEKKSYETHALFEQNVAVDSSSHLAQNETSESKNAEADNSAASEPKTERNPEIKSTDQIVSSDPSGEKQISEKRQTASKVDLHEPEQKETQQDHEIKSALTDEKIPDNVSNKELVKIAFEDAKSLKEEAQVLSNNAEHSRLVASEQDSLSKSQVKEAQDLLKSGVRENRDKAKQLLKEAEDNKKQSEENSAKASESEAEAKKKNEEADQSVAEAKLLMTMNKIDTVTPGGKFSEPLTAKENSGSIKESTEVNHADLTLTESNPDRTKNTSTSKSTEEKKKNDKVSEAQKSKENANDTKSTSSKNKSSQKIKQAEKSGAETYSSSSPSTAESENKTAAENTAVNSTTEKPNVEKNNIQQVASTKLLPEVSSNARESYQEHMQLLNESKAASDEAEDIQGNVNYMPESKKRDSLIARSNELNVLSIKKWQEAQTKLNEAKKDDPAVEQKMLEIEKAAQPQSDDPEMILDKPKQTVPLNESSSINSVPLNSVHKDTNLPNGTVEASAYDETSSTELPADTTSPVYPQYAETRNQIVAKQTETIGVFAEAIRFNKLAQQKKEEEISIRDKAVVTKDSKEKYEQLQEADALKYSADSLNTISQEKFRAAQRITGEVATLNSKVSELKKKMDTGDSSIPTADASTNPVSKKPQQNKVDASQERPDTSKKSGLIKWEDQPVTSEKQTETIGTAPVQQEKSIAESEKYSHEKNVEQKLNQVQDKKRKEIKSEPLAVVSTPPDKVDGPVLKEETALSDEKIFHVASTPVYTESNPIPMDPVLPDGLVFKVQIGAFHTPLPYGSFKNIQPITGETTRPGWIRYCVGLFQAFEPANLLKGEMKTIGYKDAFVVAYYNGKRIELSEAYSLISKAGADEKKLYASNSAKETSLLHSFNIDALKFEDANDDDVNSFYGSSSDSSSGHSEAIEYAVQVGVYKSAQVPNALTTLLPLHSEMINKRLYRFVTGRYDSYASADSSKRNAIQRGVKDAFIVAYKNGNRIALSQTHTSQKENYSEPVNPENTSTEASQSSTGSSQIIYKVQLGAFRQPLSNTSLDNFRKISSNSLSQEERPSGLTLYYSGSFTDLNSAMFSKNIIVANGIKDAFVVGFSNGRKIPLNSSKPISKR